MSRSRAGVFPAIKASASPPPPADPGDDWVPTPRGGGSDSRAAYRIDHLEGRLSQQERTSHTLLDRAYRIKEDIINNLEFTRGTWQEEKKARVLLQDHIRTITDIVRKLSKDIVILEEQIRLKDTTSEGTTSSLRQLETQSASNITDLRGRVGRCDASIAKLAADLKTCYESLRATGQQQTDNSSRLTEKINAVDAKFASLLSKLEKLSSDHQLALRHVETDSTQQVSQLDGRTQLLMEETRGRLNTLLVTEQAERERLEAKMSGRLDKVLLQRDVATDKLDRKMEDGMKELTRKVAKLEEDLALERERNAQLHQRFEERLSGYLEGQVREQTATISKVKRECRDGFSTVHESITNMKEVLDGKRRILEEQLRKEISQIRKMVVLI